MKKTVAIAVCLGFLSLPAIAHHSFAAEYDASKTVTVTGTITKVEWTNPHCHFFVDVKDAGGQVANWTFELAAPNELLRKGMTRNTLKLGDRVTVKAFLAKDGTNYADARNLDMADGRQFNFESGGQYSVPEKKN